MGGEVLRPSILIPFKPLDEFVCQVVYDIHTNQH